MIIKFLESIHQRYTRCLLDICSGYSQLLQLSSFISETVYLLTGSLESSYYSTSSVGILAIHCVNPQLSFGAISVIEISYKVVWSPDNSLQPHNAI